MNRWYVVSTQVNAEDKAVFHLRNQNYDSYFPRYLKQRKHARKLDWVPAPMFPGYVFLRLDIDLDQWRSVRSTVGVRDIVCLGKKPTPVPVGVIERIQDAEDENGLISLGRNNTFRCGDKVRVLYGAMAEQVGIFDCADDQERVYILLELMGRHVKVRMPQEAITAYA